MKKIFILLIPMIIFSCKNDKNKTSDSTEITENKESGAKFSLKTAKNTVNFVGYKTSEKVAVKGIFKEIEITKNGEGETLKDAINGAEFKIPVKSIETNDSSRNFKLQKFFFGTMKNTLNLAGTLSLQDDTNGTAEIVMNGVTEKLPFTYTINNNLFTLKSIMKIDKWGAVESLNSLNEICKDLHKGRDGVSKTWNEVAIEVTSEF